MFIFNSCGFIDNVYIRIFQGNEDFQLPKKREVFISLHINLKFPYRLPLSSLREQDKTHSVEFVPNIHDVALSEYLAKIMTTSVI